jgi:hypothetical protein
VKPIRQRFHALKIQKLLATDYGDWVSDASRMGPPEAASGFAGSHGGWQGRAPKKRAALPPTMEPMLRWERQSLLITEITEIGG